MNVMTSVTPPAREGRDSCWAPSKGCAKVSAGGNPRLAPCARPVPSDTRFVILLLPLPTKQPPHRPLHSRPLSRGPQPLPQLPPRDGHRQPVPPLLPQPLQLQGRPGSSSLPRLGYLNHAARSTRRIQGWAVSTGACVGGARRIDLWALREQPQCKGYYC